MRKWLAVGLVAVAVGLIWWSAAGSELFSGDGVNGTVRRYLKERFGVKEGRVYFCEQTGTSDGAKLYWCSYSAPAPCEPLRRRRFLRRDARWLLHGRT